MKLTPNELATVLAALRYWQTNLAVARTPAFRGHFEDVPPLNAKQVDDLCERLNMPTAGKKRRRPDGKRWFRCPKCNHVQGHTAATLQTIGDPFCNECGHEKMEVTRRPSR